MERFDRVMSAGLRVTQREPDPHSDFEDWVTGDRNHDGEFAIGPTISDGDMMRDRDRDRLSRHRIGLGSTIHNGSHFRMGCSGIRLRMFLIFPLIVGHFLIENELGRS
jgi:hypothetical protein